jgi:hypothetical protein
VGLVRDARRLDRIGEIGQSGVPLLRYVKAGMVAANYAARRSAMSKAIGFGQLRGNAGARKRGRPAKGSSRLVHILADPR